MELRSTHLAGDVKTTVSPVIAEPSAIWSKPASSIHQVQALSDRPSSAISNHLFSMMILDFTALLLGYNLPRDDARQVASEVVESVREHFVNTGRILRRARL
jgi:hypothetical protein